MTGVRSAGRLRGFALSLGLLLSLLGLGTRAVASSNGSEDVFAPNGVKLDAPRSWGLVARGDAGIIDPITVLVAGSPGVRPLPNARCQIAAYQVPVTGRSSSSCAGERSPRGAGIRVSAARHSRRSRA
jgi:hypothetical protein